MNLSTTRTQIRPPGQAAASPSASWSHFPLRDDPRTAWPAVGALVAAAVLVAVATGKFHLAILTLLAGVCVFCRVMLLVTYELGPHGLRQTCLGRWRTICWASVAEIRPLADGLMFMPEPRWGDLDALRRVGIPVREHRAEVVACAEAYAPIKVMTNDQAPMPMLD